MRFVVSSHAAERFQERVTPALDRSASAERLRVLLAEHGQRVEFPAWRDDDETHEKNRDLLWFLIGDDLAALCEPSRRGDTMVVVTVTHRGLISASTRARRNVARARRQHQRRDRRRGI